MQNLEDLPTGARVAMDPAGYVLEMRVGDDDHRVTFSSNAFESRTTDGASVECEFDGEVLTISLVAEESLYIESCRVALRHAFATDEQVLLNGYQSWTDTVERHPWSKMRGLRLVSPRVVDRWALDGGGDYRFATYPNEHGKQHGYTYGTFRRGDWARSTRATVSRSSAPSQEKGA